MPAWFAAMLCSALLAAEALAGPGLLIAVEDDWPPYSARGAVSSAPRGLAPQLVREAFRRQGVAVSFVTVPFARCLMLARVGRAAGCLSVTITDDNREQFWWHQTPMFTEELAIFARAASGDAGLGLKDLIGRRVGITQDYSYPSIFYRDVRIMKSVAASDEDLIRMLLARRVDYVLMNALPGQLRIRGNPAAAGRVRKVGSISQDGFWLAFSKARAQGRESAAQLEAGLRAMRKDGSYASMLLRVDSGMKADAPSRTD
ncbi:ABC transporter substrate-binding protein [Chromobacterium sp. LK1]|uniref:substrate-binding periplasmic protein n=1 Tax=Chromobacterium sp. LK1 TaxID=1628193 RepID=UPI000A625D2B|nr:transporter substrate-binding domain-containing protein [Chromobacterium sp. LK1]